MPLPTYLASDLRNALRSFRAANGHSVVPTSAGRALEAWLVMRLARAARATGTWTVTLRLGDGKALRRGGTFALPTSQAGILPSDPAGPGFVQLERMTTAAEMVVLNLHTPSMIVLELHGSLQWKGRSDATHELDVSLLNQSIATPLRNGTGGHPRGLPIAAYECKDKTNTALPDEMRQSVARLFDLALVTRPYPGWECRMFEASVPTPFGLRRTTYRESFAVGAFGVVRAGGTGPGANQLGQHYFVDRYDFIYGTGQATPVEDRFTKVLESVATI